MTKSPLLSLIIFIFLAAPSVFSQKVQDVVNFQISFHENKTVYRIGEPIRLKLSFTASKPGFAVQRYNWPLYDDVILSPNDVDYTWNFKRLRSGSFVYDVVVLKKKLSQSPVTVDLTLNDRFRFDKPRKYRVKVVSSRVWGANDSSSSNSFLSNEIKFEIKEMTEAEERVIGKRLDA